MGSQRVRHDWATFTFTLLTKGMLASHLRLRKDILSWDEVEWSLRILLNTAIQLVTTNRFQLTLKIKYIFWITSYCHFKRTDHFPSEVLDTMLLSHAIFSATLGRIFLYLFPHYFPKTFFYYKLCYSPGVIVHSGTSLCKPLHSLFWW